MDRFDRIYALHQTLRKARHPVSSDRLRDEMGNCSLATLRDIVRQMRENLYAPIESSRHDGGGYWYAKEDRAPYELPGLWFNTSELLALITCLNLLHEIEPGALEPAIEPLREKIQSLIEHQHLGAAGQSHRIRILKLAARPHDPVVFRSIAEAVLLRRRLTFHYAARHSGEVSLRNVSPQRLTHYRDNWYLDTLDHGRTGLRIFSVDQITQPRVLNEPAEDVDEATLNRELTTSYGIFAGPAKHVAILRFTTECARWVADESWHPAQQGAWLEDGRFELRIPYGDPTELIMDVLKYGPDVEVVAPVSLRDAVASRLRDALLQYQSKKVAG